MHKLECSAMTAFGENWCPSEVSRLVARILAKKVEESIKHTMSCMRVVWQIPYCSSLWSRPPFSTENAERKMCV